MLISRNQQLFRKMASTSTSLNNSTSSWVDQMLFYCVQIVRERDYENYLAALLMPKRAQPRIFSILALNAELSTLRHKIRRHSGLSGINQLTFWRESLQTLGSEATKNGKKSQLLPRQPVVYALKAFSDPSVDLPHFLNLVKARQQTLGDRPFQSVASLEQNSQQLYGSLLMLQLNALHDFIKGIASDGNEKFPSEALKSAVNSMACSIGILTLLRATVMLLRNGIVLLPNDLTTLYGINHEQVYRLPNILKDVVKDLCEIASNHLNSARAQQNGFIPPQLRPAFLTVGLRSDFLLGIFRGNNFNVLDARLQQKSIPFCAWRLRWRNWRKDF